ncbi:MAG: type II toxin-antitoxin system HicB family antitoxin [Acidobacteria bacterium]|nr:type II toxin-antitoxin system HicB family antitoxin [Acidobacteriota bacterium]
MKTSRIDYPFEIRPLSKEEGGGYSVTFPDLPGCCSDGATPEEAISNGRDALESWLAVAREFGDEPAMPFSNVSGRFVQRVPRSLHAQLIERAKMEGVSLNTLVVSIVSQGLGQRQAEVIKDPSSDYSLKRSGQKARRR